MILRPILALIAALLVGRAALAAPVGTSNDESVPPVVTATANPASLWPANKKNVNVTVSGSMTDEGSGLASASYAVLDSYGLVQPGGSVTVGADGRYSFVVPLMADRNGSDKEGRKYTIVVRALDRRGNASTATAVVIVPHDQR